MESCQSARYCTYQTNGELKLLKTRQNKSVWEIEVFTFDPDENVRSMDMRILFNYLMGG